MEVTLNSMPFHKQVHGSWLVVHRFKKESTNYDLPTTNRKSKGFSLIELLIVIAILGVLSSITSILLIGHLKQARDTQRINDMQTFKKVMEQARGDCIGQAYYPTGRISIVSGGSTWSSLVTAFDNVSSQASYYRVLDNLKDPKNSSPYLYSYNDFLVSDSNPPLINACPAFASNVFGSGSFMAFAQMEMSDNASAAKSNEICTQVAYKTGLLSSGTLGTGKYYVCSD